MNGEQFAETYGITSTVTELGYDRDADGWEHYRFDVTLTRDGRSLMLPWRQGVRVSGFPTVGFVLEALALDVAYAEMSFEDFCEELGHDTDSRRAYRQWEELREQQESVASLLGDGDDALSTFHGITEDEA